MTNNIPSVQQTDNTTCSFQPAPPEIWAILNGTHIGFKKILEEFLDNSFSAGAKNISISLIQEDEDTFRLIVEDNGCGISADVLPDIFSIGHADLSSVTGLHNLYGIGLKSALASCDPSNSNWIICSRTADNINTYIRISAPFSVEMMNYNLCNPILAPWPGTFRGTGTWISVPVSRTLFESIDLRAESYEEQVDILREELQVTYAPLLDNVKLNFHWIPLHGQPVSSTLSPLLPTWVSDPKLHIDGHTQIDLGAGPMEAVYHFGRIIPGQNALRYYCGNITSSGLMVYLNGRLIQANLFPEVWNQPHPQYNTFLFILNLKEIDGNRAALPIPTPDKDQMVLSDPRFAALSQWVHKLCPRPRTFMVKPPKDSKELLLCREFERKLQNSGHAKSTQLEMPVFADCGDKSLRTDIYACMDDGRAVLYEAKVGSSKVQDLTQLAAYFLGASKDGLKIDELVLLAKHHPACVVTFCKVFLNHWFKGLAIPNIRFLTWDEVDQGAF